MKFGKQVIDQESLDRQENLVARWKQAIESAKTISKGGPDGIKIALTSFKEYRHRIIREREQCYEKTNLAKMLRANVLAGEEKALNIVIGTFENTKETISAYNVALAEEEKRLDEWKKLPVRE